MAQGVTLTEQMGAMGLVDELRHRQMVVQEHINLPERRAEVSKRIREYYKTTQVTVDDALIETGVRKYFDGRLTFEAPKLSKFQEIFARLYITKDTWWKPAASYMAGLAVVAGGGMLAVNMYEVSKLKVVESLSAASVKLKSDELQTLGELRSKIEKLKARVSEKPLSSASRMLEKTSEALSETEGLLNAAKATSKVSIATMSQDRQNLDSVGKTLDTVNTRLNEATERIAVVEKAIDLNALLGEIVSSPAYGTAAKHYPKLVMARNAAVDTLDKADVEPIANSVTAVERVRSMAQAATQSSAQLHELQGMQSEFSAMGLISQDQEIVKAQSLAVSTAIENLDTASANTALQEMKSTLSYAKIPLTLNIVDRKGTKSGVERNYKASGGKSWFVVVEATDSSSNVMKVPVTSAETGERTRSSLFAVRVTEDEYKRVKADKLNDGHVDNKLMGTKPANSLSFKFNERTTNHPDTILSW